MILRTDAKPLREYQARALDELKRYYARSPAGVRGYLAFAPGGGKTLVAKTFIVDCYVDNQKPVLWLAWDWSLLDQAVAEMRAQYAPIPKIFARIGTPDDRALLPGVRRFRDDDREHRQLVIYSTVQSFARRIDAGRVHDLDPELIVIDEAHHGMNGALERSIHRFAAAKGAGILGLTGTPKPRQDWGFAATPVPFNELVEQGFLATPVVERIATHRSFTGALAGGSTMISSATYRCLAGDDVRNRLIVEHYEEHASRYGKTIVFACNKEHATDLARRFSEQHKTVLIHDGVEAPKSRIKRFKEGDFEIAVGVQMLRQGIDVPDVKTVFLCAPTTSDVAFFQMVCRASRRVPGKTRFFIVDFEDHFTNDRFAGLLIRPSDFFYGASGTRSQADAVGTDTERGPRRAPTPRPVRPNLQYYPRHNFSEPTLMTLRYPSDSPVFSALDGLRVNSGQTFGIEFELTSKGSTEEWHTETAWQVTAARLLDWLRGVFGQAVARAPSRNPRQIDYRVWNVVYDASCGWELVTPIMLGQAGFEDIALLLQRMEEDSLLEELGLHVNWRTGLHVHLGWRYGRASRARKLLRFLRKIEPALASLVPPSRVVGINSQRYCESWRNSCSDEDIQKMQRIRDIKDRIRDLRITRYRSVNICGILDRPQRVEVRLHSGSVEAPKVLTWVALWMNILWATYSDRSRGRTPPGQPAGIPLPGTGTDADIVKLAVEHLHLLSASGMLERIHRRRLQVVGGPYWRRELGNENVDELLEAWEANYRAAVAIDSGSADLRERVARGSFSTGAEARGPA